MPHAVLRTFDGPNSELLGVQRERALGDRVHLDAAKLLVERKILTLTALAVALRDAAEGGSTLEQTLMSSGRVRPMDYYKAIADVYGVRFVDLKAEPIDESLVKVEDRADYTERHILPWRRIDGRLMIATTEIRPEHFLWGDQRFGPDAYDFVIAAPLDSPWEGMPRQGELPYP